VVVQVVEHRSYGLNDSRSTQRITKQASGSQHALDGWLNLPVVTRPPEGFLGMKGPRRTAAQQTGQVAEAAFAKAAAKAGMIWHPTSAGSDFGIDGKVEIVQSGTVGGAEFNVQIKGTTSSKRIGQKVDLGLVKVSTVTYWTSKLLPTLLVVYDEPLDRLFHGWLHDVTSPAAVLDRQTKGHDRMRLRMPPKLLNESAWGEVETEARRAHEAVRAAFDHAPVRSYYHVLYCLAADVTDLLADVVAGIAYESPLSLSLQFGEGDPERMASLAEEFANCLPPQPAGALKREAPFVLMQIQALDHEMQAFLFGKFMFHPDNPIVRATETVQRTLRGIIDEIMPELHGPEPTGNKPALRWAKVEIVNLVIGVGLILVLLRDYQRELRPFLFPIWGRLEWPVPSEGKHAPPLSTRMVRDISDELVTSFASWRSDADSRQGKPADQDTGGPTVDEPIAAADPSEESA
jgi:Domain of unknown function (DUF4365)